MLWGVWLPSDVNVCEDYSERAKDASKSILGANEDLILVAELAVAARNNAVAAERRRTSPLGLIFALWKKPRLMPLGFLQNTICLNNFLKRRT